MTRKDTITVAGKTYRTAPELAKDICAGCAFDLGSKHCDEAFSQYNCHTNADEKRIIWIEDTTPEPSEQRDDDPVNHPSHYTSHPSGVECIQVTEHMTFNCGNAIKYIWRNGLKDGQANTQDLQKAIWYLNREIERLEKNTMSHTTPNHHAYLLSLYTPPFRFDRRGGYIWDAQNKMVADNYDPDDAIEPPKSLEPALRIRGWGYIQYLKHDSLTPEQIQNGLGEIMAQALTEYWQRSQPKETPMEKRHTFMHNGITYISADEIYSPSCTGCEFDKSEDDCLAANQQYNCSAPESDFGFIWVKQDARITHSDD